MQHWRIAATQSLKMRLHLGVVTFLNHKMANMFVLANPTYYVVIF